MSDEPRTKCCPISHTDENVQYRWWNKNDSQYYCEFCEQLWSVIPGQGCERCDADRVRAANYLEVSRKFQSGELRPLVPQPKEVIEMPDTHPFPSPLTSGGEASNPLAAAQRPTPRTDTETHGPTGPYHLMIPAQNGAFVKADFARTLERELAEANETISILHQQIQTLQK